MIGLREKEEYNEDNKLSKIYYSLILAVALCVMTVAFLNLTEEITYKIFHQDMYLTFHLVLEFMSALIGFATFTVLYYTFDLFKKVRNIFLAQVFLYVSFIDILHVLSYNGMPEFLTANSPQKATAYWIISRLAMGIGILIFSLIKREKKTNVKGSIFLGGSIGLILLSLYMVTYKTHRIPLLFIEGEGLTTLKVVLEYIVVTLHVITIFVLIKEYKVTKDNQITWLMMALVFSIFSELTFTLYVNVYDTYNMLGHIFKIIAYFLIFKTLFLNTIRKPYAKLFEVQGELENYVKNLEKIVDDKTKEVRNKNKNLLNINEKIIEELEGAKQIQQALLPVGQKDFKGISFYSEYIPCDKLSGDFYNYFRIDDDNIGFYIIDVSGHGVSAAMVTVFSSIILKGQIQDSDGEYSLISPSEIVSNFYDIFNKSNFPDETYLVMMYGNYNTKTKELTYSSAGHNCSPVLVKKDREPELFDMGDSFPICKLGGIIDPEYKNYTMQLNKGDRILFYTDGIIEAKDEYGKEYSSKRLENILDTNKHFETQAIMNRITADLSKHKDISKIDDDITLFFMEVK